MTLNPVGLLVLLVPEVLTAIMLYPRLYLRTDKTQLLPVIGFAYLITGMLVLMRPFGGYWTLVTVFGHAMLGVWVVQLVLNALCVADTSHPIARRVARYRF